MSFLEAKPAKIERSTATKRFISGIEWKLVGLMYSKLLSTGYLF